MLAFAVGRGWYGIRKSKAVLILLTPAVLACFYMGRLFLRGATYQTERLKAMFGMMTGKEIPGDMNYQWLAVRQALGQLRAAGTAGVRTTGTVLPSNENYALLWVSENYGLLGAALGQLRAAGTAGVRTTGTVLPSNENYALLWVSENYGLLGAALLLALLAALTVVFCKRTGRQKNRLGALAGAGCIYVLATTAAIHVLTNFGAFLLAALTVVFCKRTGRQKNRLGALAGAGCIYVLATTAAIHVLTNFGAFIPTDLTVVFCKRTGRQKNRLGALAGAGCIYVLATTAAIHVLTNFGAFIPTDCALPFISMNGGQCIALYVLMGILLSVYRGSDIRPEPSGICVSAFGKKGLKLL